MARNHSRCKRCFRRTPRRYLVNGLCPRCHREVYGERKWRSIVSRLFGLEEL